MLQTSARKCWALLIIVLFLSIPSTGYSSDYPQWLKDYHDGALKLDTVYFGVGSSHYFGDMPSDESRKQSKDRALNELCYQLSVSVKSEFKEKLSQNNEYSDEQIESSLLVSTQNVISGVKEMEKWTDNRNKIYWVMVSIEKEKADGQVKEQAFVNKVVDRLANNQQEIINGLKKITADLAEQMQFNQQKKNNFEKLLQIINHKATAANNQTKAEFSGLAAEIKRLGAKWDRQEEMLHRQNSIMEALLDKKQSGRNDSLNVSAGNNQLEILMAQNKALQESLAKISNEIRKDYFLTLAEDDAKHQIDNQEFNVSIEPSKGQGADYFEGEMIRFKVKATKDCYIKVIHLSTMESNGANEKRLNTLLFPNVHDQDNFIQKGESTIIGKKGELFVQKPFGKDVITVIASRDPFEDIKEDLNQVAQGGEQYIAKVTQDSNEALKLRSIGVVSASNQLASYENQRFVTDTCFITTHQ